MDFSWTQAQDELYERVVAFGRERAGADTTEGFSRARWQRCGQFGLLGLSVPQEHGGMGLDALTTARAIEGFGRGCADMGLVFSIAAQLFACAMPIAEHAAEALKQRVLPPLCEGRWIGANAITEAEAGSDAFALKARAVREGDDYILDGSKSYVTNGPVADAFIVYASTNPKAGYLGLSAFLVERVTPGVVVGQPFEKMGLEGSPIGTVYFEDCRVPLANRIGAEGQGARIFQRSMQWERACLFAAYLGMMDRQLEGVLTQARERRQFGRPIAKNQAVSHRIVDMKLRLEAARALLYRACWLFDQGKDATLDICLAKLAVSEAAVQSGLDAIQIFGGAGYMRETGVEQMLRDAIPARIFSGTSEMQRELIAGQLGL